MSTCRRALASHDLPSYHSTETLPFYHLAGSDSGAKPDEAVSWGKVRLDATPVKVTAEATIIMPLLVAQTFAREA